MAEYSQRLSIDRLKQFESLQYGMFIHFGMSTYDQDEFSSGELPASAYNPEKLDVRSWMRTAVESGMRYAVLTAKHVSGFCLWPSAHTDYHVGRSGNTTDVIAEYMNACAEFGLEPGIYYCSWDNHHLFGSLTRSHATNPESAFVTREYMAFQSAQLAELAERYPGVREWWIDIPAVLPRFYRDELYTMLAHATPDALIVMNNGWSHGGWARPNALHEHSAWPTDVMTIERETPSTWTGHVSDREVEGARYYIPGEVCDTVTGEWFHVDGEKPRGDRELLGMYMLAVGRGANLLLDVGPNRDGLITSAEATALKRLAENIAKID